MKKEPLITIGEAAKVVGVSAATLGNLIKRGMVRAHGKKVRLSEVIADRKANLDPAVVAQFHREAAAEAETGTATGFAAARTRKEKAVAALRELEVAVRSGRLVDADVVRRRVFEISRQQRDALLNWPARVAPIIASSVACDQVKLAVELERHVRQFLVECSEPDVAFEERRKERALGAVAAG
jgi:hypothetical protein